MRATQAARTTADGWRLLAGANAGQLSDLSGQYPHWVEATGSRPLALPHYRTCGFAHLAVEQPSARASNLYLTTWAFKDFG